MEAPFYLGSRIFRSVWWLPDTVGMFTLKQRVLGRPGLGRAGCGPWDGAPHTLLGSRWEGWGQGARVAAGEGQGSLSGLTSQAAPQSRLGHILEKAHAGV